MDAGFQRLELLIKADVEEVALDHHSRALVEAQIVMKIQAPVVSILKSSLFFPSPLTMTK